MKISQTPIDGLAVVDTNSHSDHRGSLMRLYCQEELREIIGKRQIVQINQSCTRSVGAVRGLHYQRGQYAEMKLVRCLKGKVWDVAVDLRAGSPTFLKWHAQELSPDNTKMMVIPEGCAHGFQTLTDNCELIYLHTTAYHPEAEGALNVADPRLGIDWPLPIDDLSDRDRDHALIDENYQGLIL
jgi:dTDP-4-dehydrorhamnose 3,5-epimerase